MKFLRLSTLSLTLAVVTVLLSLTAGLAFAQEGNFENDGTNYDGRILVITDPRGTDVTFCGRALTQYKAVVISAGGGPAIVTTVAITSIVNVMAGDRFDIMGGVGCGDGRISTELTPK